MFPFRNVHIKDVRYSNAANCQDTRFMYDAEGNLTNTAIEDKKQKAERGETVVTHLIPARQVRVIYNNLKKGIGYPTCSPMYDVTREQVAFILTNPPRYEGKQ